MSTGATSPAESALVRVVVPDVPVAQLLATERFQRSVLREFDLMFAAAEQGRAAPGAQILMVRSVLQLYETAYKGVIDAAEQAAAADLRTVDITIDLPRAAADAARLYLQLMDEVDADARQRRLLTPPDPEVTRFRRWFTEQVIAQLEPDPDE